jgi:hypothetical protein
VQDRGPFGVIRPCADEKTGRKIKWNNKCMRWKSMIRPQPGWTYRGEFDLTRPVAEAIGHSPFDEVVFFYWRPATRRLTP